MGLDEFAFETEIVAALTERGGYTEGGALPAGRLTKKTVFYVRTGNSSRALDGAEKSTYILGRWPGPLSAVGPAALA